MKPGKEHDGRAVGTSPHAAEGAEVAIPVPIPLTRSIPLTR
jgi:hypothetical protein